VVLVHQAGRDRLGREVGAVDGEVVIGLGLERAHRSGSKVRSILAFALDTDSSVVEYTIFSAACQSRAYCRVRRQVGLGCAVSRCAWSPKTIVSYIRRP
jgi:hypothetical protein